MVIANLNILDFRLFDAWKSQTIFSQMVVSLIVIYHGRIHKTSSTKQTKDISFNLPPTQDAIVTNDWFSSWDSKKPKNVSCW